MIATLPAIVITIGLVCDIAGTLLVANEVVNVFRGPATIDKGSAGHWGGTANLVPNPEFDAHETKKRKIMKWSLGLFCEKPALAARSHRADESRDR
jgi:hypothetical protein